MHCNIDHAGRRIRRIYGWLCLAVAVTLTAAALLAGLHWGWWIVAGFFAASGLFALYEARKGWCVVRAMGFKTPV